MHDGMLMIFIVTTSDIIGQDSKTAEKLGFKAEEVRIVSHDAFCLCYIITVNHDFHQYLSRLRTDNTGVRHVEIASRPFG